MKDLLKDVKAAYTSAHQSVGLDHTDRTSRRLFPGCLTMCMIFIIFLFIPFSYNLYISLSLAVHRVSTVGTITSYQASDCIENKDHSHAEILFLTSDDLPVTFEDTIDFSCNHHVGESVPVFYNPDNPQEAEVATSTNLGSKPPIYIVYSVVSIVLCPIYTIITINFIKQFYKIRRNRKLLAAR